ncbi:unnamed protein product [Didymodactylos carnosus]|uniref:Uncharacterized protein n=1 Tax=Didymodactylos carnosus TaxID=1234261 RepID=A0A813SN92_9BILA|nr:unnamed protein product [Didymodactylos carnosus]CAF0796901.1 unnamed protein product [Didymodactylos carnosus]CAF3543366.1 unnamed protein product [Didymodactylos carnosus]CAF3581614.1 unnamed protein product [Didymodactylos carnosus]
MVLGRFPHYTAKLISNNDKSLKRGEKIPKCKVCQNTLMLNDFVLYETKTVLINGRPIEGRDTYPTYNQYWHAVNCFGFYKKTIDDDKQRIKKLRQKYGDSTKEFNEAYNELLNRRFPNFDKMTKSNQNILETIMEKGECIINNETKPKTNKRKISDETDDNEQSLTNKRRKTIRVSTSINKRRTLRK